MRLLTKALLVLLFASFIVTLPVPAHSVPRTLASVFRAPSLTNRPVTLDPSFFVDYLGVSVSSGGLPDARFQRNGRWTRWVHLEPDDVAVVGSRKFSSLRYAGDADKIQLRGSSQGVRAVTINTTDGPRRTIARRSLAKAAHLAQPGVISRAGWGADESYRFAADGTEKWPPAFFATQKLIVHHTATRNSDPDPAATVRAIYRYHAIDKGWGDIGYNFLVDEQGRIYKGRYSGLGGTSSDTSTGEDADGKGVTAAHTSGANSGTMGIAMLGTLTTQPAATPARSALIDHLAWEAERHGLDPLGSSTYTNPITGSTRFSSNISGHRDWTATECPGDTVYADLPNIRNEVAVKVAAAASEPDVTAPSAPTGLVATSEKKRIQLTWSASSDEGGSGLAGYEVWRATSEAGPFSRLATTSSTQYEDRKVSPRRRYWYRVVAYDFAGNRSTDSNTATAVA